jgi:hypothetical protein
MAMGTSVFRIRTAVDFSPVLESGHTMRSCSAASLHAGRRAVPVESLGAVGLVECEKETPPKGRGFYLTSGSRAGTSGCHR